MNLKDQTTRQGITGNEFHIIYTYFGCVVDVRSYDVVCLLSHDFCCGGA